MVNYAKLSGDILILKKNLKGVGVFFSYGGTCQNRFWREESTLKNWIVYSFIFCLVFQFLNLQNIV